jgi:type II secretory pathway component GspD/PulD (secretin)
VFLEVAHRDGSDIGLEGGVTGAINNHNQGAGAHLFGLSGMSNAIPLSDIASLGAMASPMAGGLYQILGKDYQITLKAIAEAGRAKVLSRPSVLARNNQPATILVGQTVPLITSVRYDQYGNALNGVTYTDVGIILRVTPYITSDGMVEMIISPEISSVSQTDKTTVDARTGAYAPYIDKRSADTVVVTPDGQTVIIGGLIQNQKAKTEVKIPLLGDIPGLGVLFKRTTTVDNKTELLIFLTPHIVQAPSQLAALSSEERAKSSGIKAFPEQEMNKFLDSLPTKSAEGTGTPTATPATSTAPGPSTTAAPAPSATPAAARKSSATSAGKGW